MIKYRADIDGLRAIAVLPVIFFHAGFHFFSGGFVGVDVFFVISGYLITGILLREQSEGRFSIVEFYERRARRILPALFLVMAATVAFSWFWLLPSDFKSLSHSIVATVLYSSNFLFWQTAGYFDTAAELKPLLHTWSLAVEEQFYFIFPLILAALWRYCRDHIALVIFCLFLISLATAELTVKSNPNAAFYLLHTRGWELLAGALCAVISSKRDLGSVLGQTCSNIFAALGAALLSFSIFFFSSKHPFPSIYTLVPVVGTVLIILFASNGTVVGRFLQFPPLVHIGLISYSAYLWHQPLLALARHMHLGEPSEFTMLALCVVTLFLAHLTWKFIETPFRDRSRISKRSIFLYSGVASAIFLVIGVVGHLTNGLPQRFDPLTVKLQQDGVTAFHKQLEPCISRFRSDPRVASACKIGDTTAKPLFAVVGDSHAGALVQEIDRAASVAGLGGRNLTFKGCPPLLNTKLAAPEIDDFHCESLRADFFHQLKSGDEVPPILIVHARWTQLMERTRFNNGEGGIESGSPWVWLLPQESEAYRTSMEQEISRSIHAMLASGRTVILIYPVPEMGWQVPSQLAKANLLTPPLKPDSASTSHSLYLARAKHAISALDSIGEHSRLIRIRPADIFCNTVVSGRCIAHMDSTPLYFDDDHLSNHGARPIAQLTLDIATRVLREGQRR